MYALISYRNKYHHLYRVTHFYLFIPSRLHRLSIFVQCFVRRTILMFGLEGTKKCSVNDLHNDYDRSAKQNIETKNISVYFKAPRIDRII
jgi:hypothetical protein